MRLWTCGLSGACLLALAVSILGCNNTLNPLCSSARPAPLIGSLSPSTMTVAQLQQGETLTINGNNFVSSSEVMINSTPLGATIVSPQEMTVKLTTDVISGPGQVKVMVQTPGGNTGDLGCTSGGKSSVLTLTVN
jgi:IPT/TIG domain